jgi:hypothetical protein
MLRNILNSSNRSLTVKNLSVEFFYTMIEMHPNFTILYYADLMSNIEIKFKNKDKIMEIDFPLIHTNFNFGKMLYFCDQSLKT